MPRNPKRQRQGNLNLKKAAAKGNLKLKKTEGASRPNLFTYLQHAVHIPKECASLHKPTKRSNTPPASTPLPSAPSAPAPYTSPKSGWLPSIPIAPAVKDNPERNMSAPQIFLHPCPMQHVSFVLAILTPP